MRRRMTNKHIWCPRNSFYLDIRACQATQKNPEVRCPKNCEHRNPPDDRGDEEKFWPKKEEAL